MKVKITPNSARFAATYDDYTFDVTCTDRQGRQYWREVHSKDLDAMDRLAQKVNKCGEINNQLWACYVPYGSTAWDIEGHEYDLVQREKEDC